MSTLFPIYDVSNIRAEMLPGSDDFEAPKRFYPSQVGFAEFNNTADNRANIGGTIIGAPIVGQ